MLPKADHEAPEWQAAMEALMLVAALGGPTMFARNRHHAGAKSARRARVKSRSQRPSLGQAEAEARSVICAFAKPSRAAFARLDLALVFSTLIDFDPNRRSDKARPAGQRRPVELTFAAVEQTGILDREPATTDEHPKE